MKQGNTEMGLGEALEERVPLLISLCAKKTSANKNLSLDTRLNEHLKDAFQTKRVSFRDCIPYTRRLFLIQSQGNTNSLKLKL